MPNVAIAVLAAGEGKRMGRAKQLVSLVDERETLLERAIKAATETRPHATLVVLGCHRMELLRLIPEGVLAVHNEEWREGISSSIRIAVSAVSPEVDAILFTSCDQPFVHSNLLEEMMNVFAQGERSVVASLYCGSPGIPALFARNKFHDLLQLKGDRGAKKIILASEAHYIEAPEAEFDIDSEEDLARCVSFAAGATLTNMK